MSQHELQTDLIAPEYTPPAPFGSLTPAIHHASTVTFANVAAMRARTWLDESSYTYGLHATPTTYALQHRIARLEGGSHALLAPSGLAAIALINLGLLQQGDAVLVPDNVYGPNREMGMQLLQGFGIATRVYDPSDLDAYCAALLPDTRLVWVEAPGSVSMEVCDVGALSARAHERGVLVAMDNTWSGGVYFNVFEHGVDIAMHALTKYPSGGSDVLMGAVVTRDVSLHQRLKMAHMRLGLGVSGDDAYLVMRGLTSLSQRLKCHEASAYALARWLAERAEVARVLHPGLPSCPGHAFWQRDFTGAGGLFSVEFAASVPMAKVDAMVDRLRLFSIGYSWGGSHSLAVPYDMRSMRTARAWTGGALVRFFVGLEELSDLQADLAQAFAVFDAP